MKKRGELSSGEIITIILAIAGLAILIGFLYFAFSDSQGTIDSEACRLSILTRATAPTVAQSSLPLKCQTKKLCLSVSGKDDACSQFAGEDAIGFKLSKNEEEAANEIQRISAEAMYECWSVTGEGKVDLFGKAFDSIRYEKHKLCVVCSRVAIADDVFERFPDMKDNLDFNEYIKSHGPYEGESYLSIFQGHSGARTYAEVDENALDLSKKVGNFDDTANALARTNPNSNQIAFVFAQRRTEDDFWSGAGKGAELGAFTLIGFGASTGTGKFFALSPAGWITSVLVVGGTSMLGGVSSWQDQMVSAGYCGQFGSSAADNVRGCSIIRGVDYKVENINSMCDIIESIP